MIVVWLWTENIEGSGFLILNKNLAVALPTYLPTRTNSFLIFDPRVRIFAEKIIEEIRNDCSMQSFNPLSIFVKITSLNRCKYGLGVIRTVDRVRTESRSGFVVVGLLLFYINLIIVNMSVSREVPLAFHVKLGTRLTVSSRYRRGTTTTTVTLRCSGFHPCIVIRLEFNDFEPLMRLMKSTLYVRVHQLR